MSRSLLSYSTVELIFGALAKIVPDRVMAPSGTYPLWIQKFAGQFDDGREFVSNFNAQGGQGALADRDGNSAVVFPGNVASTSVELMEVDTPLTIASKRFRTDSGGPGRHRGGLGQEVVIESRGRHAVQGALSGGRFDVGPQGLEGGGRGARAEIRLNDGPPFPRSARVTLRQNDRAILRQPGGGGFGDPFSRDPDAVLADVRENYVSIEGAARDYGVVIDPATLEIEAAATGAARSRPRTG
jgi:N-methylhydantoinase B